MDKLVLCSGPYSYGEGFKTLDANPSYKPDYCVELPPLPKEIRNGKWEEIYLIHGIEHFLLYDAMQLLKQSYEALCDGGTLILEQPNLKVAAEVFLGIRPPMTTDPANSGIAAIYGDQKYYNPLMGHKWGWTPESLVDALYASGFPKGKIKIGEGLSRPFAKGRDFRIEATK